MRFDSFVLTGFLTLHFFNNLNVFQHDHTDPGLTRSSPGQLRRSQHVDFGIHEIRSRFL
ncbi:hypothetical protein [Desulfonatronum parangueonense]